MTNEDVFGLALTGILALIIVAMALIMIFGKGSSSVSVYNIYTDTEKKKYNTKAFNKFLGKVLLPIGILIPSIAIGKIIDAQWIGVLYLVVVIGLIVFAAVYCSTGNRFRE